MPFLMTFPIDKTQNPVILMEMNNDTQNLTAPKTWSQTNYGYNAAGEGHQVQRATAHCTDCGRRVVLKLESMKRTADGALTRNGHAPGTWVAVGTHSTGTSATNPGHTARITLPEGA